MHVFFVLLRKRILTNLKINTMKKLTYVFIALTLLIGGTFVSCNKITDLLEVTIPNVTFDADINVDELTTKDAGYAFGGSGTINPSANSDVAPYLATIRRVEIKEVKVTVNSVTPSTGVNLLDAYFTITDTENGDTFTYNVSSTTALTAGTEFILDSTTPNFGVVSDIISNMHEATISLGGHVDQTGFTLGFNYSIRADVTVGVPQD